LKKEVKKRTQEIDIANYKLIRQKAKLEYNDKFKEEIINGVLSGIITIDKAEKVTSINANGSSILKVEKSSMLGRDYSETILANIIESHKMENVLLKGNSYKNQVVESYENGDIRTYEYSITPLMNEDGTVNGTIVSFNDISQEVKLREELARGDKMKSLGLMVAGFAHEIRNPLTSIKAMTDIMNKKIEDRNFRDKFTEIVPKEINRLDNLIIELLEFSKPRKANIQIVEIREIIDSIYVLFNEKIKEKNMDFIVDIDRSVKVYADKQQIKQVLINLILNSIESIPEKGEIRIFEKRLGDKTEIFIEDNGKGISPDNLKKIMDPFYTTKNNGTGLGLFICYQIVKKNNGDISIRSKLGEGTSVSITLFSPEERSIYHA